MKFPMLFVQVRELLYSSSNLANIGWWRRGIFEMKRSLGVLKKLLVIAVSLGVVAFVAMSVAQFRRASYQALVSTAFGELIGCRMVFHSDKEGLIRVPVSVDEFGPGHLRTVFTKNINEIPSGDYRYTTEKTGERTSFSVFSGHGELVARGIIHRELSTLR